MALQRPANRRKATWDRQDHRRRHGAIAIDAGWQCALMAPTEILAEHFRKLIGWLEPLLAPRGLRVLLTAASARGRGEMLGLVASGEAALVVGIACGDQNKCSSRPWPWR
jgi:hypothetical protein